MEVICQRAAFTNFAGRNYLMGSIKLTSSIAMEESRAHWLETGVNHGGNVI